MGKLINLIGQKYGEWTVLEQAPKPKDSKSSSAFWLCKCSCGTKRVISGQVLRQGKSKSCGCKASTLRGEALSEDLTGLRFGALTVISRAPRPDNVKSPGSYFLCQCDCGTEKVIMGKSLRSGKTKSCGCHLQQYDDLIGQRFGKLLVIAREPRNDKWTCKCDCGNITHVTGSNLKHGNVKSCGCLVSYGEYQIEKLLNQNNIDYIKQYSFSDLIGPGRGLLRFDFAILNDGSLERLVEFQGEQHYSTEQSQFFDKVILTTDNEKEKYCLQHNIPLVRIPYWKRQNLTIDDIMGSHYLIKTERAGEDE